ncbi:unnamed protein product [Schistosoma margrebowiei]|uniref:Uncharacterized protein n=1 Tax=Schistosoma margrebowiei TaxID=48269 RepID=A0A183MZG8_9TREM|nr:unnamed protein product [Schistosoma margrebowiei]
MVVGGSQQETLDPDLVLLDTRQQDVPIILRGLVLPDGFDPMSLSLTVRLIMTTISNYHAICIVQQLTLSEYFKFSYTTLSKSKT